jgi:integrase
VKLIARRGPTLGAFVEEWWELYANPNLERSTLTVYRWAWEHHARPRLDDVRLRDVSPLTIARFRAELEASGVGAETIRKTLTLLQSVFQRAVEWQLVDVNPVRSARKPPLGRARAVPAIGPSIVEAMRADLLARGREPDARLVVLLAYAGLRPGEALGLEWHHVRERTLVVEQAVSDGHVKGLKNRRRPRAVRLLTPLRDDLEPTRTSGPVIARSDGGLWRETDWRNWRRRVFRPAAARAGLTGARPYDLRHAFASLLIAEGQLSIVEIAAQLGHNPTVCLDIYGHEMAERAGADGHSAEERIWAARGEMNRCST